MYMVYAFLYTLRFLLFTEKMSRHFFALWPDDETRARLAEVTESLQPGTGRPVPRQNLHITLAFLGTLAPDIIIGLRKEAALIRGHGFSLTLLRVGWWKKPKVLWAAPDIVPDPLLKLVSDINTLAGTYRIKTDGRPYKPHLTLARKVFRKPGTIDITPISWQIDSFCLVRSNTLPEGAVYEIIETWPLSSG